MSKVTKILGKFVIAAAFVFLMYHRYSRPDITDVRWFIDFWYIWLIWAASMMAGVTLYLRGVDNKK